MPIGALGCCQSDREIKIDLSSSSSLASSFTMLFFRAASGGVGGWMKNVVQHFSGKRAEDVRRINHKVPKEEAVKSPKASCRSSTITVPSLSLTPGTVSRN